MSQRADDVDRNADDVPGGGGSEVNRDDVLDVVERFAITLADSGIPRMAARVFSFVLVDEADRYTAQELASSLGVSAAAISGAVRYLVQVNLLTRGRTPGARVDHYRIYDDDIWGAISDQRLPVLDEYAKAAAAGTAILTEGSAGWRRMKETEEYFAFMAAEQHGMVERWREYRRTLFRPEGSESSSGPDRP